MENTEGAKDLEGSRRTDGQLLTASQLVEKTHEELKTKLNREIHVPKPPSLLLETQKVAEGEGFKFFEPIYFPKLSYRRLSDEQVLSGREGWREGWIDWREINGPFAVKGFTSGSNFPNPSTFGGFWALFDKTPRPNYNEGKQLFDNDEQLGSTIADIRHRYPYRNVPPNVSHVPETSRFGFSLNDICSFVFRELSSRLRLEDARKEKVALIRTPKLMEFNFAGNTRYPFLGKVDTWEWLYDTIGARTFFICGSSDPNNLIKEGVRRQRQIGPFIGTGLAAFTTVEPESSFDRVAFRPEIVFGKDNLEPSPIYYRMARQLS